jgi:hypothetical protein
MLGLAWSMAVGCAVWYILAVATGGDAGVLGRGGSSKPRAGSSCACTFAISWWPCLAWWARPAQTAAGGWSLASPLNCVYSRYGCAVSPDGTLCCTRLILVPQACQCIHLQAEMGIVTHILRSQKTTLLVGPGARSALPYPTPRVASQARARREKHGTWWVGHPNKEAFFAGPRGTQVPVRCATRMIFGGGCSPSLC